jgi:hypothetical protein
MGQQQQFRLGVYRCALPFLTQPGPADFQGAVLGPDIEVAGTAHRLALLGFHDGERQLVRRFKRLVDPLSSVRQVDKTAAGHEGPVP